MFKKEEIENYLKLAIALAEKGRGYTKTNPLVGCVIVKNKKIIATGYHQRYGESHAEVMAIKKIKDKNLLKQASLFVTLEPCCHYGKTPPCTQAIIESGIKEVYCGIYDPNPIVNKKGVAILKKNNIKVYVGFLEKEIKKQNEVYFKYVKEKKPFVIAKAAITLDGKMATLDGSSQWITDERLRKEANRLRCYCDAVLVGINTIIKDNPLLTCRVLKNKKLKKIVLDPNLKIDKDFNIFKEDSVIIFYSKEEKKKIEELEKIGAELIRLEAKDGFFDWQEILAKLYEKEIACLLIEGGAKTISSALKAKVVDKIFLFYAPKIMGKGLAFADGLSYNLENLLKIKDFQINYFKEGFIFEGYPVYV
jgi:diaminohydroxyphosphoribosylaminopyrimidine deaminase/5-amino-6-(5-phosphoribosylamino)uracil reductase